MELIIIDCNDLEKVSLVKERYNLHDSCIRNLETRKESLDAIDFIFSLGIKSIYISIPGRKNGN